MEEQDLPHHLHVAQPNERQVRKRYSPLVLAVATTLSAVFAMGLVQRLRGQIDPMTIFVSALGGFIVTYLLAKYAQCRKGVE